MKRLRAVFLLLAGVLAASTRASDPPDLKRIVERGEIIIALPFEDTPPFVSTDSQGQLVGFDIDLLTLVANELRVKPRFVRSAKSFEQALDLVHQKKVDLAAGAIFPTLRRAERLSFSDAYLSVHSVLAINRVQGARRGGPFEPAKTANDPRSVIGVYADSGAKTVAQALLPMAKLQTFDFNSRETMLTRLMQGLITGAFIDELEEMKWRNRIKNIDLFVAFSKEPQGARQVAFAVNWQDQHLLQWVNLFLRIRRADGSLRRLIERYFGSEVAQR